MGNKSGGRIFLVVLGFLVLACGMASIAYGLIYLIPDIEKLNIPNELYYLMGGTVGILIAIIFLIIGFRKVVSVNQKPASSEYIKEQGTNTWNTESRNENKASNLATLEAKATFKIKENSAKKSQSIICQKCGVENVAGSYYCSGCKSALKKICKLCGYDNPHGTEICEGCGKIMQIL